MLHNFYSTKMASIPSTSQLPCKFLQRPDQVTKSTPKSVDFSSFSSRSKRNLTVRATSDVNDEWGSEKESPPAVERVRLMEPPEEKSSGPSEIDLLKKQLVDSFYGTDRGLTASSETRAEIVELITLLEAKNPTPAPTEALELLNGKWVLVYTSFAGLFPLLSRGRSLPFVKIEEISQTINSSYFTVQNAVLFSGPFSTTSLITNAKFEVRSPKRVQIKFEEGVIGTPQLTDSIVFPENVELFGQKIDLSPFKGVLSSVQDTASSVANTISRQPPLKFPISGSNAESWLLTTYLDEEIRIARGDGGSISVLIKADSPLLKP